jgi:hypothetical protein
MLTNRPLPLTDKVYVNEDPAVGVEVEPVDGTYIIWIDFVPLPDFVPCRLLLDPVDTAFYRERYEVFSREFSPFNERLYFRKGGPEGAITILGNTRFSRSRDGLEVREFSPEGLCDSLKQSHGVSDSLVEKWAASGALHSTFNPVNEMARLEVSGKPPSRR